MLVNSIACFRIILVTVGTVQTISVPQPPNIHKVKVSKHLQQQQVDHHEQCAGAVPSIHTNFKETYFSKINISVCQIPAQVIFLEIVANITV